MCLPSIIDIAGENAIEVNPRTLNKKEVMHKCPFCLGDSNRAGKYFLSLNPEYNVFKCWHCNASGGVLEFESRITGKPFKEVRSKYFTSSNKKAHPAERLSPIQLKKIGWNELKRRDREKFKQKRQEVLQEWQNYERREMVKHFALLMVTAHLDDQIERQRQLLEYILRSAVETGIPFLYSKIMEEFIKDEDERSAWTIEAIQIARAAWKSCLRERDYQMEQVVIKTAFINGLTMMERSSVEEKNQKIS